MPRYVRVCPCSSATTATATSLPAMPSLAQMSAPRRNFHASAGDVIACCLTFRILCHLSCSHRTTVQPLLRHHLPTCLACPVSRRGPRPRVARSPAPNPRNTRPAELDATTFAACQRPSMLPVARRKCSEIQVRAPMLLYVHPSCP